MGAGNSWGSAPRPCPGRTSPSPRLHVGDFPGQTAAQENATTNILRQLKGKTQTRRGMRLVQGGSGLPAAAAGMQKSTLINGETLQAGEE